MPTAEQSIVVCTTVVQLLCSRFINGHDTSVILLVDLRHDNRSESSIFCVLSGYILPAVYGRGDIFFMVICVVELQAQRLGVLREKGR